MSGPFIPPMILPMGRKMLLKASPLDLHIRIRGPSPFYDWFIAHLPVPHRPRQIEFARLNTSFTITSKRKLKQLVDDQVVAGWDDPVCRQSRV
ncbi:MAG: hypothetical protein CM15mP84_08830 [Cellvibrionales bacterium]|nr:MAG: hypothetical protein CM15mP84_08830 [Cellvibrionales bacterium]